MTGIRIQASFGGFSFWVNQLSGPDSRRIVKHPSWGRDGVETEDTGSDGFHERLTAVLTYDEYMRLRKLCHQAKVRQFTHPLFGSFRARINIPDRAVTGENVDHIETQIEVIQDTSQPLMSPFDDETPSSRKSKAIGYFDDAAEEMSGTPGDDNTRTVWATFVEAKEDFETLTSDYESGAAKWEDIEKALDSMKQAGWAVIDNLGEFDSYQEGAYQVNSSITQCLYQAHSYVESIRQSGVQWFQAVTTGITDVYTLCLDTYGSCANVEQVLNRNRILDPFYIEQGTLLELPVP